MLKMELEHLILSIHPKTLKPDFFKNSGERTWDKEIGLEHSYTTFTEFEAFSIKQLHEASEEQNYQMKKYIRYY